jgi:hypothetical protein
VLVLEMTVAGLVDARHSRPSWVFTDVYLRPSVKLAVVSLWKYGAVGVATATTV